MIYIDFIYTSLVKNASLKNMTTTAWFALLLAISLIGLAGCSPGIPVVDKSSDIEFYRIIESTQFNSPVWLPSQQIAFVHDERKDRKTWGALFDLEEESWQSFPFEDLEGCVSTRFNAWQRLPDGRLGFIYECRDDETMLNDPGHYLIAWNEMTGEFEILRGYDTTISPYVFAVLPDFKQLFQETTGGSIHHKLYRASLTNDDIELLFPDFYRAGSPSLSPSGETVAFAANEDGPGSKRNLFTGFFNLSNEILYPWQLYLMETDGSNVRIVLSDIQFLSEIKWSPVAENLIAFRGKYKGKLGLWLYDLDMNQLTFLWPEDEHIRIQYDWSPDGNQMVLQDCISAEDYEISDQVTCTLTILTVPVSDSLNSVVWPSLLTAIAAGLQTMPQ